MRDLLESQMTLVEIRGAAMWLLATHGGSDERFLNTHPEYKGPPLSDVIASCDAKLKELEEGKR